MRSSTLLTFAFTLITSYGVSAMPLQTASSEAQPISDVYHTRNLYSRAYYSQPPLEARDNSVAKRAAPAPPGDMLVDSEARVEPAYEHLVKRNATNVPRINTSNVGGGRSTTQGGRTQSQNPAPGHSPVTPSTPIFASPAQNPHLYQQAYPHAQQPYQQAQQPYPQAQQPYPQAQQYGQRLHPQGGQPSYPQTQQFASGGQHYASGGQRYGSSGQSQYGQGASQYGQSRQTSRTFADKTYIPNLINQGGPQGNVPMAAGSRRPAAPVLAPPPPPPPTQPSSSSNLLAKARKSANNLRSSFLKSNPKKS
ncbi:hypothetical protein K474DRAFT_1711574 [Panus rudis PR-1116 ss-1]|nr:hypothetical protein K474DRAFT_1711574 [Panus rudis PR-1116 ss-1]